MRKLGIDEVPKAVKGLPVLARHMWLRVYNRSIKINSANKAIESAWNVINQFYKRTPKGKWAKRP